MIDMRPKDLAVLLLAAGEAMPRKRARDQQADIAGLELKRRVLNMLVSLDPEPEALEPALLQIVQAIGPPDGPTRAICATVRDDWEIAAGTPEFVEWLIGQALREDQPARRRRTTDGGRRTADDGRPTTDGGRRTTDDDRRG